MPQARAMGNVILTLPVIKIFNVEQASIGRAEIRTGR
jgi:hypothetical protein